MLSQRLITLLRYAKSDAYNTATSSKDFCPWKAVVHALSDIYHPAMSLATAIHHVLAAFNEALGEPKFQLGDMTHHIDSLVLAPVTGFYSVELAGPPGTSDSYTIEEFYNSMIKYVLGHLMVAPIDWCANEYFPDIDHHLTQTPANRLLDEFKRTFAIPNDSVIADVLNIPKQMICDWRKNRRPIPYQFVARMREHCGYTDIAEFSMEFVTGSTHRSSVYNDRMRLNSLGLTRATSNDILAV